MAHRSASPRASASPPRRARRSRSPSRSRRSRSRSRESEVDAANPGNNLYVTGLSTRVSSADLEKYFSKEGKVVECHLVTDPRSRESRGFAFVTMETVEDADRCIKYLNRSVLEGRLITVEKAKRKRGRTPTPGRYHGMREKRGTHWNSLPFVLKCFSSDDQQCLVPHFGQNFLDMAADVPAVTHLVEILIQGTAVVVVDPGLHIVGGRMIMIHIVDAGSAHCLLIAATGDSKYCLV
ncbi:hypothetical protein Tsubulata_035883 [Turnera subulata]|uniref:RRM domain-containing protein n=1 Tax=Turnera subulata TaxID=218843 RepID=A0A9Q0JGE4_9ROSI|nr:hypothetical protein Tsubulata_035883 [Turnera subulata]